MRAPLGARGLGSGDGGTETGNDPHPTLSRAREREQAPSPAAVRVGALPFSMLPDERGQPQGLPLQRSFVLPVPPRPPGTSLPPGVSCASWTTVYCARSKDVRMARQSPGALGAACWILSHAPILSSTGRVRISTRIVDGRRRRHCWRTSSASAAGPICGGRCSARRWSAPMALCCAADEIWEIAQPVPPGLDAYSVLDVETTGLNPVRQRVIEVACTAIAKASASAAGRRRSTRERRVPGLHPAADRPEPGRAGRGAALRRGRRRILARVEGETLVGHNVGFDIAFLNAELARDGRPALAQPTFDTLPLSMALLPTPAPAQPRRRRRRAGCDGPAPPPRRRRRRDHRRLFRALLRAGRACAASPMGRAAALARPAGRQPARPAAPVCGAAGQSSTAPGSKASPSGPAST